MAAVVNTRFLARYHAGRITGVVAFDEEACWHMMRSWVHMEAFDEVVSVESMVAGYHAGRIAGVVLFGEGGKACGSP
eukprot:1161681-Pelagomonas_calceolata.AAC.17